MRLKSSHLSTKRDTVPLRPPQIGEGKEAKRTFGEETKYIKECAGYGTDRRQRERVWVRGYKH